MESLINLYKELDAINLIIFWGIVVVIILIIILIIIMITKKKKMNKSIVKQKSHNHEQYEEELPIKKEEEINQIALSDTKEEQDIFLDDDINIFDNNSEPIDIETKTITKELEFVEETNEIFESEEISSEILNAEPEPNNKYITPTIEMPTGPYQRNVLREMSLSQTSPIGINRKTVQDEKQQEIIQDLSNSLNFKPNENNNETTKEDKVIRDDLAKIENPSPRKTEIINIPVEQVLIKKDNNLPSQGLNGTQVLEEDDHLSLPKELLDIESDIEPNNNDPYLEEVSKKLSETEPSDEIERTDYEIRQEEDAIISYQELMEKKDSIQTIDEEDAIISIEELINRENNKKQEIETDNKLYNINETEENDQFIKELKQFRKDL